MKNKKSKIIVPAVALILLSTAASISGSVAWFTASRTTVVKTGEFKVVRTGDDLHVALEGVAGISSTISNQTLVQKENYKLTDASFDHRFHTTGESGFTTWSYPYVVNPDVPRENILTTTPLNTENLETALNRGTNTFSAYVWNMTFSITYSESSTQPQGLFLDLASGDTYMNAGSVEVAPGGSIAGLYTKPTCKDTESAGGAGAKNNTEETKTYYQKPSAVGKGFRIAFIPTAMSANATGSKAYAKVWAYNETNDSFGEAPNIVAERQFVGALSGALTPTSYDTTTLCYNGTEFSSVTASKVLLPSGEADAVPADNEIENDAAALAGCDNYLGSFALKPSATVTMTFTCVAWFEGTNPYVDSSHSLEHITSSMRFGVANLRG